MVMRLAVGLPETVERRSPDKESHSYRVAGRIFAALDDRHLRLSVGAGRWDTAPLADLTRDEARALLLAAWRRHAPQSALATLAAEQVPLDRHRLAGYWNDDLVYSGAMENGAVPWTGRSWLLRLGELRRKSRVCARLVAGGRPADHPHRAGVQQHARQWDPDGSRRGARVRRHGGWALRHPSARATDRRATRLSVPRRPRLRGSAVPGAAVALGRARPPVNVAPRGDATSFGYATVRSK